MWRQKVTVAPARAHENAAEVEVCVADATWWGAAVVGTAAEKDDGTDWMKRWIGPVGQTGAAAETVARAASETFETAGTVGIV